MLFRSDRYEYIVKNILGFGGIVENVTGGREKWLCKAAVKFAKGRLVSGGDSLENLCVDRVLFLVGRNDAGWQGRTHAWRRCISDLRRGNFVAVTRECIVGIR